METAGKLFKRIESSKARKRKFYRQILNTRYMDAVLSAVRQSKTNQEGDTADVRFFEERCSSGGPHTSHRQARRRAHGALDGAQWPGWARVRFSIHPLFTIELHPTSHSRPMGPARATGAGVPTLCALHL